MTRLEKIWLDKISNGDLTIGVSDLYQFSKIRLSKKRNRKKFNKKFYRYISDEISIGYLHCLMESSLLKSFKLPDLDPILKEEGDPEPILYYFDYKYDEKINENV